MDDDASTTTTTHSDDEHPQEEPDNYGEDDVDSPPCARSGPYGLRQAPRKNLLTLILRSIYDGYTEDGELLGDDEGLMSIMATKVKYPYP